LKALEKTSNGFELAEADLKIRGPGEFTGIKQSGIPDLAMASLTDLELIKKARLEAKLLLTEDPNLNLHPILSTRLSELNRMVHFE
jgi:ATP-dependent DNA helicase RecG